MPDFEPVGTNPATVKFIVKNLDGGPITNARIFVGHHEARVSPIADTNPATPAAGSPATVINLDDTAKFAQPVQFYAQANGYGLRSVQRPVPVGRERDDQDRDGPELGLLGVGGHGDRRRRRIAAEPDRRHGGDDLDDAGRPGRRSDRR